MKTVLLDTSILIDFLRRKKERKETLLYLLTVQEYKFAISLITYAELYAGKIVWENKNAQEELEKLLSYIDILPFEKHIAKEAGIIRAKYNTAAVDAIIASTAIAHDLELVTLNIKDFKNIKELRLFNILV